MLYKKIKRNLPIISGKLLMVGCLVAIIFIWQLVIAGSGSGFLEVDFYDIGQGDAIFIEGPQGEQILIDGGSDSKILEKLGKEMNYFDRYIDIVVATHPDKDHINGLIDVLKYYDVGEVWISGAEKDTSFYNEFMEIIEGKNINTRIVGRGDVYSFNGFDIVVLNPKHILSLRGVSVANDEAISREPAVGEATRDERMLNNGIASVASLPRNDMGNINNTSIVTKIIYNDFSVLLTGDIEKEIEAELVKEYDYLISADILKVAHHGSKSSSKKEFIENVSPELSIIQVGKDNPYHHPHQSILERFNNLGIPILRNDIVGDIEIVSDGGKYTVDFNN